MEKKSDTKTDHFQCQQHHRELLIGLCNIRKNGMLHDVKLECNGVSIPAHRIVLASGAGYFRGMFTGQFSETQYANVHIGDVDAIGLQLVVDYIYGCEIEINEKNVQLILHAADLLRVSRLKDACCEFLQTQIIPGNCLSIHKIAGIFSCPTLCAAAEKCMEDGFRTVVETDDFLEMTICELRQLLLRDKLNAHEDVVFDSVGRWFAHDEDARKEAARNLCTIIRYANLSEKKIQHLCQSEEFLSKDAWYVEIVEQALSFKHLPETERKRLKRNCRKVPDTTILMSIAGEERDVGFIKSVYGIQFSAIIDRLSNEIGDGTRAELADLPHLRKSFGVACVDNLVYVIGGYFDDAYSASVDIYDPIDDAWHDGPSMINKREHFGIAVISNQIYVVGGRNDSEDLNECEILDISIGEWRSISAMDISRLSPGAADLDGKIYAVGGYNDGYLSSVQCYDPVTDRWSTILDMHHPRYEHTVCSLNNRLYAIGGSIIDDAQVEVFTVETNVWEFIAPMHKPRCSPSVLTFGDRIYVIGGLSSSIEEYDPSANTWTLLPWKLPENTYDSAFALFSRC